MTGNIVGDIESVQSVYADQKYMFDVVIIFGSSGAAEDHACGDQQGKQTTIAH